MRSYKQPTASTEPYCYNAEVIKLENTSKHNSKYFDSGDVRFANGAREHNEGWNNIRWLIRAYSGFGINWLITPSDDQVKGENQ